MNEKARPCRNSVWPRPHVLITGVAFEKIARQISRGALQIFITGVAVS